LSNCIADRPYQEHGGSGRLLGGCLWNGGAHDGPPACKLFTRFCSTRFDCGSDPAQGVQPAKPDPSEEKICEKITVTGSRLGSRKICATRAEWVERRRQDRTVVDGIQAIPRNPCGSVNQEKGGRQLLGGE